MMDAFQFKSNLRETQFSKDKYQKVKRAEHNIRCKQARETSIKERRKIPESLECSNECINVKENHEIKKAKRNKPSRLAMLLEWRKKQDAEKKAVEQSRKAPFVVKHIVYKEISDGNGKDILKIRRVKTTYNNNNRMILKNRNTNDNSSKQISGKSSLKTELNKPAIQRQSYNEWKKSQDIKSQNTSSKKTVNKSAKEMREQPYRYCTQSGRNNVISENKKNSKQCNKTNEEVDKKTVKSKNNPQDNEGTDIHSNKENDNLNNCEQLSDVVKNSNTFADKLAEEPSGDTVSEEKIIKDVPQTAEALVEESVVFEPPVGLAFLDFKLNEKVVLDFVYGTKSEDSELFFADISNISGDSIHHETGQNEKLENISMEKEYSQNNIVTKTPILAFKVREGIKNKTPTSTPKQLSMSASKKVITSKSLTPNPKNFLHKIEDPIAQQMETPKSHCKLRQPALPSDTVLESVKHFTALVAKEEEKFKLSLQKWEKIHEENIAPEEFHGNILAAIGQAQLFMRKRFKQFKDLIELHQDTSAEKAAHASDLDGFWEMIYYQVEDVHKRFEQLDKLEQNGWVKEALPEPVEKKVVKKTKSKKTETLSTKNKASKRSDFQKFKKQMMAKKNAEENKNNAIPESENFVKIMTPLKTKDGERIMTPVRRSIRNLPDNPKEISSLCMVFSVENKHPIAPKSIEKKDKQTSEGKNEESEISEPLLHKEEEEEEFSLRRSTRKTPSKYKSCVVHEEKETDISKYLFKTVCEDQPCVEPVKGDLMSFSPANKEAPAVDFTNTDYLLFASPLPQSKTRGIHSNSLGDEPSITADLLL